MKATGIVRRIDELGRIVIPKEIRKSHRLNEGDPIEFYLEQGKIVLRKQNEMEDYYTVNTWELENGNVLYLTLGYEGTVYNLVLK